MCILKYEVSNILTMNHILGLTKHNRSRWTTIFLLIVGNFALGQTYFCCYLWFTIGPYHFSLAHEVCCFFFLMFFFLTYISCYLWFTIIVGQTYFDVNKSHKSHLIILIEIWMHPIHIILHDISIHLYSISIFDTNFFLLWIQIYFAH